MLDDFCLDGAFFVDDAFLVVFLLLIDSSPDGIIPNVASQTGV
jgi:hypothetical protein